MPSPTTPSARARARELVSANKARTRALFGPPSGEPPDDASAVALRDAVAAESNPFLHPPRRIHALPSNPASTAVALVHPASSDASSQPRHAPAAQPAPASTALTAAPRLSPPPPQQGSIHPPWRPYRVISGHLGWVRCVSFDPSNRFFATGSADRTIKLWDAASGRLKLTLTGHIATVRAIAISERHAYMFSVGEDKTVKCWDMEQNKVIRNYHGHLSGVYCAALHPTLDVLMTGGRDSTVRVWDIRTRASVFVLAGHRDTVNAVLSNPIDPQIVSASVDSTVRLWDLAAGKTASTLTHHKRGVRALASHPRLFSFVSASADAIKTWALPEGRFMRSLRPGDGMKLVNTVAVNEDGVLVSGGDDGIVKFWDYESGKCFQTHRGVVQPGSLEAEHGVLGMAFDRSGGRLVTCEVDKTVRMWREDEEAAQGLDESNG